MSGSSFRPFLPIPSPEALPHPERTTFEIRFLRALAEAVQPPQDGRATTFDDAVAFLHSQRASLPHLLPQMLALATWILDLSTLATRGRRFHRLSRRDRTDVIAHWRRSRLGPIRNFMKFHDVYVVFFSNWSAGPEQVAHAPARAPTGPRTVSAPGFGHTDSCVTAPNRIGPNRIGPNRFRPDRARPNRARPDRIRVEIAVIGSGPGGAVTGAMLAKAGLDVAMFEEGAWVRPEDTIPFSPDEMARKLRNSGQTMALGKAMVAFWEGRCLGGGSEVNRGLYHRPSPEVVAAWAERGAVDALSPDDLTARAATCEGTARVSLLPGPAPRVSQKMAEGATALGWHHMEVPRLFDYDDDWQTSPQTGCKQSMSNTFIPDFVAAGGRLFTGTRVRRISHHDGGWRLQATAPGPDGRSHEVEIRARKVFVACGATQTPALLRRSGITRRVGDSLRFHTMIKAVARFAEPLADENRLDPVHQVKEFDPRFSLGASVSTAATATFGLSDRMDMLPQVRDDWRHLGVYYAQTTGGRGTVRTLPGFDDPLIRAETGVDDLTNLAAGLRSLCEILFAAGAIEIYPNLRGGPTLRSSDDLDLLPDILAPDRVSLSTLHLLASCPMGRDPRLSVADSFGRVHDTEDLYLADSAMLPGPTVVNPQGTIMAMAHRNAEHFLAATVR